MPKITTNGTAAVRLLSLDRTRGASQQFFNSIIVVPDVGNTGDTYLGFPLRAGGVEGAVSATNYDAIVKAGSDKSVTVPGEPGAAIDASKVWFLPVVADEGGAWFAGVKS